MRRFAELNIRSPASSCTSAYFYSAFRNNNYGTDDADKLAQLFTMDPAANANLFMADISGLKEIKLGHF
jgi:hypothetical protein